MRVKRTFLISFFLSFIVMMTALGVVWLGIVIKPKPVTNRAERVPIINPGPEDSKTLLLAVGQQPFFFIIKLNAIENRIGIVGVSADYKPGRDSALWQIADFESVAGCQSALKENLGINIDYYLSCSWGQLRGILKGFEEVELWELGQDVPSGISSYLLKNASRVDTDSLINRLEKAEKFMDNEVGLAFMTECCCLFMRQNRRDMGQLFCDGVKEEYNGLNTNLNSQSLERLLTISKYLARGEAQYQRTVVCADEPAAEQKVKAVIE